ncbi:MAG: putative membrane protein [Haloquadratum sp. J07HQX50]|nr:MAG: putative membrane protein [Haloquadratum sp. J07HQX50]
MSDIPLQDTQREDSSEDDEIDLEWLTLEDGESIRWASAPHRYSIAPAVVIGVLFSIVLIGIPIIVGSYLQYTNTNYVVTDRGLYSKRGVLSKNVKQIGFEKVQNISYSQSALGSSLGYGSVDISTAGGSGVELQFRNIPDPASIQELIAREIDARQQPTSNNSTDTDDVLSEILFELRAIRSAVTDEPVEERPSDTRTVSDERPTGRLSTSEAKSDE